MTVDNNYALVAFNGAELVATDDKGTGKVLIPFDKLPAAGSTVDASTFQVAFTDGTNFSDKVGVPTFTVPETTTTSTTSTTVQPTTTTSTTTVPPTTTSTTTSTTVPSTTTTTTSSTTVQPTTSTTTSTTTVQPTTTTSTTTNK